MKNYLTKNIGKEVFVFIAFIIFYLHTVNLRGQTTLPPEMNKMFFENSDFKYSIALNIPPESSMSEYQNIKDNLDIYESGISSIKIEIGKKVDEYDRNLTNFLVINDFARIETLIQTKHNSSYGNDTYVHHFIFYSDEFRKRIVTDQAGKECFVVGKRKLSSIDYKNEYEDAPLGMKRKFFATTFSYKLISEFPNIISVDQVFKGKAKAFQDPDDGTWKMEGNFENLGLNLEDKGGSEFLSIIKSKYPPFDFKKSINDFYDAQVEVLNAKVKMEIPEKLKELDYLIFLSKDFLEKLPDGTITVESKNIILKDIQEIENGYTNLANTSDKCAQCTLDKCNALKEQLESIYSEMQQLVNRIAEKKMEIPIKLEELDSLINSSKEFIEKLHVGVISVDSINLIRNNIQEIEDEYHNLVGVKDEIAQFPLEKCDSLKGKLISINNEMKRIASTIKDIDGNKYKTVQIGDQIWMAENLRTTALNDSTPINKIAEWKNSWKTTKKPAYCWYNDNVVFKSTYGALYNWYTVSTNKLCPVGWHVSSDSEWKKLTDYLGGEEVAGGKLKEVGFIHWKNPNEDATNSSGFSALPGGSRDDNFGGDASIGEWGYYWTSSENTEKNKRDYEEIYYRSLGYGYQGINNNSSTKNTGFSVRCVKD
jgi:uncharacterized protein (TIGR02145 family)